MYAFIVVKKNKGGQNQIINGSRFFLQVLNFRNEMMISSYFRNVLQDEAGRLKVTDFGLSKIAQEKDVYGYKMTGGTGSCIKIYHFYYNNSNNKVS